MPRLSVILFTVVALLACASTGAQAKSFHGIACTRDCSGHKAGYNWAKKKNITDPSGCRAKAKSFNEGCLTWVREHAPKPPSSVPEK